MSATLWTVAVTTTGEPATRGDLESVLSFAHGWTVTASAADDTARMAELGRLVADMLDAGEPADELAAHAAIRLDQLRSGDEYPDGHEDGAGDEYRPCAECGDDVRTLSSRDWCDACELGADS